MATLIFDSDDLERTEEFLSSAYAPMRIGGHAASTRARITRDAVAGVSVDELALDFEMSYDVNPLGKICLCSIRSGTIEDHAVAGGNKESFGAGEVFSFAPPDRPHAGRAQYARYSIVMFDPALLAEVADTAPGQVAEPVRLDGFRPVSEAAARRLLRTISYLRDDVLADPDIGEAPLVVSAASRLLAAAVLSAFPHNAVTEPTGQDRRDARPDTLRRAVAYIEQHAATDIGAADIATAARVSLRALQQTFQRHLGTSPTGYLRRVRMAAAHGDLQAADPGGGDTVTAIGARWGFHHPGRFAAAYRAAYGRAPSDTLNAG